MKNAIDIEPSCSEADHDWQSPHSIVGGLKENPGVQGHGGGVIVHEVCMHCGTSQVTDTWAQDPETGEQGLTTVRWSADIYADAVAELRGDEDEPEPPRRVQLIIPADDLAEIDAAWQRAGAASRTEYMIDAALARVRGRLELPEARAVVDEALDAYQRGEH